MKTKKLHISQDIEGIVFKVISILTRAIFYIFVQNKYIKLEYPLSH